MGELEPSEENIVKKKIMYEWMGNKKDNYEHHKLQY